MNVVRSAKPWSMATPRVSFMPARPSRTCSWYDFAIEPSASDATASLPAQ